MLSFCNVSAAQAEHYYEKDDYYSRESAPQSPSYWAGKGATSLGLSGSVAPETFVDLLHGLAPEGTYLLGRWVDPDQHRAATDYTFSAPKSVSIAALVQQDDRILTAHTTAVTTALAVLEKRYAQTRVSTDKGRQRMTTGNLIAAVFPHNTSRELEPQIHSHCVVINATQLPDGQWQSFSNEEVVQNQKLLGQIYQNELAHELKQIGYEIEPKTNGQFELAGYSKELLQAFSTRRQQIEDLIKTWESEGTPILDNNGNPIASQSARYEAANLRSRKAKPASMSREKLQRGWTAYLQLKGIELPNLPGYSLNQSPAQLTLPFNLPSTTATQVIQSGIEHCSERDSIFRQTKLERFILENHLGEQKFNDIEQSIGQNSNLIRIDKHRYTTQSALHLELNTIRLMQQGQGQLEAIAPEIEIDCYLENKTFTEGQHNAIKTAMTTGDRIIAIQGVAGAGKSYALETVKAIAQDKGYEVKGYAPSAEAANVLGQSIDIETETVARLLVTTEPSEPEPSPPQLWMVDEAGLLSMRQAHDLLLKAQAHQARVILVGDRRQLSAVEAGNPFKSLQAGGMTTARLDESLRQRTQDLRIAVKAIAQGDIPAGVKLLDQAGCIAEVPQSSDRLTHLVRDYLALSPAERSTTLLLAGTHRERLELTQQLRATLQAEGSLGQDQQMITGLRAKDLTQIQARYVHSYEIGDVVVPLQNYKKQNLEKNQQYRVVEKDRPHNRLTLAAPNGDLISIDPACCVRKLVYQPQAIAIGVGDRLRWSKNDAAAGIRNGQAFTVVGFEQEQPCIQYADGRTAQMDFNGMAYIDYAWVNTIYSAQGKAAERVLAVTDSTLNQESFYVTCSRARYQLTLYTDDKATLLRLAQVSRAKENVSDYLPLLSTLISERFPAAAVATPTVVPTTDIRTAASTPDPSTPFPTLEAIAHDSTTPQQRPDPQPATPSLRERIAERLRATLLPTQPARPADPAATAADQPGKSEPLDLTAAIESLDFQPRTPAPAHDDAGVQTRRPRQAEPQQPSPGADDSKSDGLDSAPRPGNASPIIEQPQRTIQPLPDDARQSDPPLPGKSDLAERFVEFAQQLERETEAHRVRASQSQRSPQPAEPDPPAPVREPVPVEPDPIESETRPEDPQPKVAPSHEMADEAVSGRGDRHLSRNDRDDVHHHVLLDSPVLVVESSAAGVRGTDQCEGELDREAPGADRGGAEPEVIDYRQAWQDYHQRLRPGGYPIDQDRAIARVVIQEWGAAEAYKVIAQSPYAEQPEILTSAGYVQFVVGNERQDLLSPQEKRWARFAMRVAKEIMNLGDGRHHEGRRYIAQYDPESLVLTIAAKDGRGEILRVEGMCVVATSLTLDDMHVYQQAKQTLVAQQIQQEQVKEKKQVKEKSRGFEVGD
jgi:conjugative relaxase-like TrwC/TraI family protein